MDPKMIWARSRDGLTDALVELGFPKELGNMLAAHLGSPKAIDRLTAYLKNTQPADLQLIVDEMLAIRSEIDAWKEKKANEEANARYNMYLNYGFEDE